MKILKLLPADYYPDKCLVPNTPFYEFISKLNSLLNKEQEFIEFISTIKYWYLPIVSLWSYESTLNYIDELLQKYSNDINEIIIKEKLKPLLNFLLLIIKHSNNLEIFSSFDVLETIFLKTFDIKLKIVIIDIYIIHCNFSDKTILKYYSKVLEAGSVFMNMRRILMEFINNNYQFNEKIIYYLEEILLKQQKKWQSVAKRKKTNFEEKNPFLIFNEIINNNKDYRNKDDFLQSKMEYEYFALNNEMYENSDNNLIPEEREYIIGVNNFFCILNFLSSMKNNKIDTKEIYLGFKLIFSILDLCRLMNPNFETVLINDEYKESFIKDTLQVLTTKNNINIKIEFLLYFFSLPKLNNGHENILIQNGLIHTILLEMTHQSDNNLVVLTKEESYNQKFLNLMFQCFIKYSNKERTTIFQDSILLPSKDNIYLYNLDNVLYCLENINPDSILNNSNNIIYQVLIPRLINELEKLSLPEEEFKYIYIKETDKNFEYPLLIDRIDIINHIYNMLFKYIKNSTNFESVNKIDSVMKEPIKSFLFNGKIRKINNYNSVYAKSIYLLIEICNAFPTKIPEYISEGIIKLIFDNISDYFPKANGGFYLILFAIYSISIHNKGKEYLLENKNCINMINAVFAQIKKDPEYFYYKLYFLDNSILNEISLWISLLKNKDLVDIINCFLDNYNSFLDMLKEEYLNLRIEYNEKSSLNLEQYLLDNKLKFLVQIIYSRDTISNIKNIQDMKIYKDKLNQISKSLINLFDVQSFLLTNSLTPQYIDSILSMDESSINFGLKLKNKDALNLHPNQKEKLIHNYQLITEACLNNIYTKVLFKKEELYNYLSMFSEFFVEKINENSNLDLFFLKYNGKALKINDNINIHILSNNINEDIKQYLKRILKMNKDENDEYTVFNEDNYLNIKSEAKFSEKLRIQYFDDNDYNKIYGNLVENNLNTKLDNLDYFSFIQKIGKKIQNTELTKISKEDCEIIKNYINFSYSIYLILKYFQKSIFESISLNAEALNIVENLIKLDNIITILNDLFIGKNNKELSSIVLFYFIKFGGIKQLFKISYKLMQFCKSETNKKEIPIIESLIISKIWENLKSLILFFSKYNFINHEEFFLILILESKLTKELIYKKELNVYVKYIILKDLKDVFFKSEYTEENIKSFEEIEIYSCEIYKTILFILIDFWKWIDIIDQDLKYDKIYIKEYKVYEVVHYLETNFYILQSSLLEHLKKNKKQNKKEEIKINDILINLENYDPYPEYEFISLLKNSIDNDHKIFKEQKDKENNNKKFNIIYDEYNYGKYQDLVNDFMNLINKANISINNINNLRRQNLIIRNSLRDIYDVVTIMENGLKELIKIDNNFFLSMEKKLEKKLKIKMRVNYDILKYNQLNNIFIYDITKKYNISKSDTKTYDFLINKNIVDKCITSIRNVISYNKHNNFNQFNNEKMRDLIYENFVSVYLCFKFMKQINKDFEKEKASFLDLFFDLIQNELENINPKKSIINETVLIIILLNIIDNFQDIKILEPYLQKGLFTKLLHLKLYENDNYKTFYENKFKSHVTLNECFRHFVTKIFSEEKIMENLIEGLILYAYANLKYQNENKEIYLEDFLYLCSDYVENFGPTFKRSLMKVCEVVQIEKKERPSRNYNNTQNIKKHLLRIKADYKERMINIKKEMDIYDYINPYINNKNKTEREKVQLYSETNKSIFRELLKHIWNCTIKTEKEIDKNKNKKVLNKHYIFDLDTCLFVLTRIIYSFPSYLTLIINFHKGKEHKISFIQFLVKHIFPLLVYNPLGVTLEDLPEIKTKENNNNYITDLDMCIMESFRNINIIKKLIHSMINRKRIMTDEEVLIMKRFRKKIILAIDDSLKEISVRSFREFNTNYKLEYKENKFLILYKSNILSLYTMTEFFEEPDIDSQYNTFEISKIIFSEGCGIVKSVCNILKNMKIYNNNKVYHEIGVLFLQRVLKFVHKNSKTRNIDIDIDRCFDDKLEEEEEFEDDLESNQNDEMEEKEDDSMEEIREEENEFHYIGTENSFVNRSDEQNNNFIDNRNEEERGEGDFQEVEEEINNNNSNNDKSNNEININNQNGLEENALFEEDNYDMEPELDLNNIIEREQNNNDIREENQIIEEEMGESNEFEESEDMNWDDNLHYEHDHLTYIDEYSEDNYYSNDSMDDYEDDEFYDDRILFKDQFYNRDKNDMIFEKYFEDSLTFMFSFEKGQEINNLILLQKSIIKVKFNDRSRSFTKFQRIADSFIFKYISPIQDLEPYNKFVLFGACVSNYNYYIKLFNKIYINFSKFCFKDEQKYINKEMLKQMRNDIVKETKNNQMIQNQMKINCIKPKENYSNIKANPLKKFFHYDFDNILHCEQFRNFYSGEYIFSPFIHFEELGDNNDTNEKDQNKNKDNEKEIKTDLMEIEEKEKENEKEKKSEVNEEQTKERKDENNNNNNNNEDKKDEDEKSKNKENDENKLDDKNIEKEEQNDKIENNINNNNDQFIFELPNELRTDILLNLDPSMVPNLSSELQSEYHRLNGQESTKNQIPSTNEPKSAFTSQAKPTLKQEIPDINLDEFSYNEISLLVPKFNSEEILMNVISFKRNIGKKLKEFDNDFIENIILYNINDIYKKMFWFNNSYDISLNCYFQLINDLILNKQLRFKIMDLFCLLWIHNITYTKDLSKLKADLEKNSFLKKLNYLYLESDSFEDKCTKYYEVFFSLIMSNNHSVMNKYFTNFTYNGNCGYMSLKNKKRQYAITRNAMDIKNIFKIRYQKNLNVLSNLLKIVFSEKHSFCQNISIIRIFTDLIQKCKSISETNNNNILVSIDEHTLENIIDFFNDFKIVSNSKKGLGNNIPIPLLNELMIDKNLYQLIYDKIMLRFKTLKNEIINNISNSLACKNQIMNNTMYNNPFPEIILLSLIKFVGNIYNNIHIKYNTKSKESKENKDYKIKTKKELLLKTGTFIKKISDILFPCWEKLDYLLNEKNQRTKEKKIQIGLERFIYAFFLFSYLYINFFAKDTKNKSVPFIMEKQYSSEHKSPLRNDKISFIDSNFIDFFYKFCEDNKKIINFILKRKEKKFPRGLIPIISKILDLENKKKFFKEELKKLPYKSDYLRINVRRNGTDLFTDSFGSLSKQKPEQWRSKLIVSFKDEEAVDAGGVKREWLTILSKEMFNPLYMLFTLAKNGTTYTINSDSGRFNMEHLEQFEFIGKIMAKAIYDGMMLDCYFTRNIYKFITNTPISYHDMEDYDPIFYKSIKILLENDYTDKETYLTYSYNHDNLGEIQIIDLIENGRNIEVNENNKFDYVQKLCSAKLYENIKPQVEALLRGFYSIIPQKLITIFNYRELELIISGLPTIDIKDWKRNTLYDNYTEQTPIIQYFWEIIESYDNNERAEFLQFVTGSSKVPLEGFSALQGIGGVNKFLISKVFDKNFDRLPTAHTCTNQLDLPEYPNKEILRQRLKFAIKEGKGFGFV